MSLVLLALVGCGDNLIVPTDGSVDAPADTTVDAETPDMFTPPTGCTDSVTAIQTGNPGSDPSSYPAAGWWSDDTRSNGTVVVDDSIAPPEDLGCTSAKLTTGATSGTPAQDKAQLITFALAGTDLSTITAISYWAYRAAASTGGPAIHLALNVSITGTTVPGNFATLVYEPYQQSTGNAGIQVDTWQQWNATATTAGDGLWWTNKIANPLPGSQASPQPWAAFQTLYSDAKVLGYGFNVGSFNPNMIVAGDGLVFGTTTTDF
jgi:hypothetical protein